MEKHKIQQKLDQSLSKNRQLEDEIRDLQGKNVSLMDDNKKTNLKMAAIEEKLWELELKQVTGSK